MSALPVASEALDAYGVDAICADVADGKSLTAISTACKVSIGSLLTWLAADAERSARVNEARRVTAWYWDERAEGVLAAAPGEVVEISRAREIASHYRWRASKISPTAYGDKTAIQNLDKNGNPADPVVNVYQWAKPEESK
jgi:hypothetical protein